MSVGSNIHQTAFDFSVKAKKVSDAVGNFWAFSVSFIACLIWLISGPFFGFSDSWQLVINTTTTIITFLMVFIIQNSQNRDTAILNLKIDEVIKSIKEADNTVLALEDLTEEELNHLVQRYKKLKNLKTGK